MNKKPILILFFLFILTLACSLTSESTESTATQPAFTASPQPVNPVASVTTVPTQIPTSAPINQQQPTSAPPPTAVTGSCTNDARFISDITIPDGTVVQAGVSFTKTWRMRNSGTCTWDSTYRLVQITSEGIVANANGLPIPNTLPGATVDLSLILTVPTGTTPGSEIMERFQLQTANGQRFGQTPFVKVRVGATAGNPDDCEDDSLFVSDVTVPDDSPMTPGVAFTKTWRLRNTGTCTWDSSYQLVKIVGNFITANPSAVAVPLTQPGEEINISMTLVVAPESTLGSEVTARFQMRNGDGVFFGNRPFVRVIAQQ